MPSNSNSSGFKLSTRHCTCRLIPILQVSTFNELGLALGVVASDVLFISDVWLDGKEVSAGVVKPVCLIGA